MGDGDRGDDGDGARETRWRDAMAAAQGGDAEAYRKLLEELLPAVRRQVRGRIRDDALVEDVVQNALLSVHRARHTYRPERPFGPWLRTLVRNASIDALRDLRRRGLREVAFELPDAWAHPDSPERGGAPPEDPAEARLSPELREALAALPEKQRRAVTWIQLHGLSVAEAAAREGVTAGALKVRAHRGYRALRERLRATRRRDGS